MSSVCTKMMREVILFGVFGNDGSHADKRFLIAKVWSYNSQSTHNSMFKKCHLDGIIVIDFGF